MTDEHRNNVDAAEVARFEDLASRWWDTEGELRALHQMNPLRLDYVAARVPLAGARVADVGCGGGILSEALAAQGAHVVGVDAGEAPLAVARLHLQLSGAEVDYRQATAEELAEAEPGAFDAVTCMELLEHVPEPASLVAACARLLRPGAHAFFSTINRNLRAYALAVLGAEYMLRLLPRGTHDYARFIRPSELAAMGRRAGLTLTDLCGMSYNPLAGTFKLRRDVGVNYIARLRRDDDD